MAEINLSQVSESRFLSDANLHYPVLSTSAHAEVLRDAENRMSPEFRVPVGMSETVGFWLKVYTRHSSRQVMLFDEKHPEIVYEVLDYRELFKKSRNLAAYEIVSKQRTRKTIEAYKAAFRKLAHKGASRQPTREEKLILQALKKTRHRHAFSEYAKGLRTQIGQRDQVIRGLHEARAYLPRMEAIFAEASLPRELTRIALVESSFNTRAVSRAGARGVWQFMETSGRHFLTINPQLGVDERLSPLKATIAAAQLLKENFRGLRSWPLAVTAYNHGFKGLRGIRGNDGERAAPANLFAPCNQGRKHVSKLGWASRNYYAEFLALSHADAYQGLFFGEAPPAQEARIAFHELRKPVSALNLAMSQGIALHELQRLNPDIRDFKRTLPAGFRIAVPGDSPTPGFAFRRTRVSES